MSTIKLHIITLSDRASQGIYEDKSGAQVKYLMEQFFKKSNWIFIVENILLPDDADLLQKRLEESVKQKVDILITTGGTGIGPRDITPDVVRNMLDKEIPGIMEAIRIKYGLSKPNALLSRSIAGVKGKTLIYTLPGSVKAVEEYLSEIIPTIEHSLKMLNGYDNH